MRLYLVFQVRESIQVQAPPQARPRSPHRAQIQILTRYVDVLAGKQDCVRLKSSVLFNTEYLAIFKFPDLL